MFLCCFTAQLTTFFQSLFRTLQSVFLISYLQWATAFRSNQEILGEDFLYNLCLVKRVYRVSFNYLSNKVLKVKTIIWNCTQPFSWITDFFFPQLTYFIFHVVKSIFSKQYKKKKKVLIFLKHSSFSYYIFYDRWFYDWKMRISTC